MIRALLSVLLASAQFLGAAAPVRVGYAGRAPISAGRSGWAMPATRATGPSFVSPTLSAPAAFKPSVPNAPSVAALQTPASPATKGEVLPDAGTLSQPAAAQAPAAAAEAVAPEESSAGGDAPARVDNAVRRPKAFGARLNWMKKVFIALFTVSSLVGPMAPAALAQGSDVRQPAQVVLQLPAQLRSAMAFQERAGYVEARDINDAINAAKQEHRPLVVMGDVGLTQSQLQQLSRDLEGKHWTVVLVDDASGQSYRDRDGNSRYGEDAVEYGAGQGIGASGPFAQLENARTGQRDGKILVVVLKQRVLLYFGSEAQDAQQLGDKQFKGNLDRWAIQEMRNNGDVAAAVRSTVSNIDALVERAISESFQKAPQDLAVARASVSQLAKTSASFAKAHPGVVATRTEASSLMTELARAQSELDAKRPWSAQAQAAEIKAAADRAIAAMQSFESSVADARGKVESARGDVAALETAAVELAARYPSLGGALAHPDLKAMRESLAGAAQSAAKDPAAAAAVAAQVSASAKALTAEAQAYPSFERSIDEAQVKLESVSALKRASSAAGELLAAKQSLEASRAQWREGAPGYQQSLETARGSLAQAERLVAAADAAAARALALLLGLIGLFTLGGLGAGFFLRRRVRPVQKRVSDFYQDWDKRLDAKLETMYGALQQRLETWVGPEKGEGARGHLGRTKELAEKARDAVSAYDLMWTVANSKLDEARDIIYPKSWLAKLLNYFWPKAYLQAEAMLSKDKLEFKPEDGLAELYGQQASYKDKLYGDPKPFKLTFDELINDLNARAKTADDAIDMIEKAVTGAAPAIEKVESSIAALSGAKKAALEKAGKDDGLFLLPSLFTSLAPAATAAVAKLREVHKTDPVGAMDTSGAEASRMASEGLALAELALETRLGVMPRLAKAEAALSAAGLDVAWSAAALQKLSGRAERLAAKGVTEPIAADTAKLSADLSALAAQAESAAQLAAELLRLEGAAIPKGKSVIASERAAIGEALGLSAEKILVEDDLDPSRRVAASEKSAASARQSLAQGQNAAAQKSLESANASLAEAKGIVDATRKAFDEHAAVTQTRRAETSRLEGEVPGHQLILESIERDFAASVLALQAGDPAHPSANGTIKDNVDEAKANLVSSNEKLAQAVRIHKDARILGAADLIAQVAGHQAFAAHRLGEIAEKRARLDSTAASNRDFLAALQKTSTAYGQEYGEDRRSMKPTLSALEKAAADLAAAKKLVDAQKGDPFKAQAALKAVEESLRQAAVSGKNDRDVYAEAERSIDAAEKQYTSAVALANQAKNDEAGDSAAIESAYRALGSLYDALNRLRSDLKATHGDWNAVDRAADAAAAEGARQAAILKGELAQAQEAVSDISRAAGKVREASGWSGSYGVYIPGSPGSGHLSSARDALRAGRYQDAQREAEAARRAAASAIDEAEAEVARRRRAEQQRQEEERRERQRQEDERRRSSSSGGGSGGGGSSWGSSGSGMGKSGW